MSLKKSQHSLVSYPQASRLALSVGRALALPLVALVYVYQQTLSPDHGLVRALYPNGYCKFHPTCSTYALDALREDGLVAVGASFWRLVRCHPWSLGGVDYYKKPQA
jgi:putative membrane protein insertion efficiency factor